MGWEVCMHYWELWRLYSHYCIANNHLYSIIPGQEMYLTPHIKTSKEHNYSTL